MTKKALSSVAEIAIDNLKICSKCNEAKDKNADYYFIKGNARSDCKKCTIKRNILYQRSVQKWKHRYVDNDTQRSYMVEYYRKNKEKFAAYRRKFKEEYPEYYKNYARARKNKPI